MSSSSSKFVDAAPKAGPSKKQRIQRACDICRRKKIRCDGVESLGKRCTQCAEFDFDCTYLQPAKKRGRPRSYVESLENRIEQLERIIQRFCPDESIFKEIIKALDKDQWTNDRSSSLLNALVGRNSSPDGSTLSSFLDTVQAASESSSSGASSEPPDVDDHDINEILADSLKNLQLHPPEYRFFGKSSGLMLIRTALDLKSTHATNGPTSRRLDKSNGRATMKNIRLEFWGPLPWEMHKPKTKPVSLTFPDPDLAHDLVDLYFRHMNLYLPLLHRPTFQRWINDKMFLNDEGFASIYLLVCAAGARYSDDPRCLLDGTSSSHARGWKWFYQVQTINRSVISPPTLFDLQIYALSALFLIGSSAPQAGWILLGLGIRVAQDVGAHRKKPSNESLTAENEMLKRAFWVLLCMDGMVSSSLGRSCAIQHEDFDLDLPIECDDEYWDHIDPTKRFKQPPGKPSLISAFIVQIKLHQILALSLRTIYSINRSNVGYTFVGTASEQTIVAELDSSLNKWMDSVPEHLKWDPNRADENFFNQSASLYGSYYHLQVLVHRPFIPSPTKPSPVSIPSMAMCTNAARSCCTIIDALQKRKISFIAPQIQMAVFTSAMVLLLSIWGGKVTGLSMNLSRDMQDVYKCMEVLRQGESRWHIMGRLWDILYELASASDLPLPHASNTPQRDPFAQKFTSGTPSPQGSSHSTDASSSSFLSDESLKSYLPSHTTASTPDSHMFDWVLQSKPHQTAHPSGHSSINVQLPLQDFENALAVFGSGAGGISVADFDLFKATLGPGMSMPDQEPQDAVGGTAPIGASGLFDFIPFVPQDAQYQQLAAIQNASGPSTSATQGPSFQQLLAQQDAHYPQAEETETDLMPKWSNPSIGFGLDEWDAYLTNVGQMMQFSVEASGSRNVLQGHWDPEDNQYQEAAMFSDLSHS